MSNIYFMCDNCGIETNGFTFVNGMKFCAKCYHQIFGKDNQQTEITQLKQQLVEKDKEIERLKVFEKAYYFNQLQASQEDIQQFQQLANQSAVNINHIAITELEKVKVLAEKLLEDFCNSWQYNQRSLRGHRHIEYYDLIQGIDNQIKEIKGEKDDG